MTPENAVAVIRAYHAAVDAMDFDAVSNFFTKDAVYVSGGVGGAVEGRDAILAAFRAYFAEYPDQVAVDDSVEASTPFEVRSVWRLTAVSAETGIKTQRSGREIATLDPAGKIVRIVVNDV